MKNYQKPDVKHIELDINDELLTTLTPSYGVEDGEGWED